MSLPDAGRDIGLKRNVLNGLFDLDWSDVSGNPVFADDGSHMVLSLLLEYRGLWWFDSTGSRGSNLYLIKHDLATTASDIKAAADIALQPAIDDGRLRTVTTKCVRKGPGRFELSVNWVMPDQTTGFVPLTIGF